MELGLGLGMYCIGGVLLGCVLAVPVAIVTIRVQQEKERLEKEAKKWLLEYEAGAREAYRLDLTNEVEEYQYTVKTLSELKREVEA